jgi:ATP-dependent Lon protease
MKKARDILEADHYGLEDVKYWILEYLSVAQAQEGQPRFHPPLGGSAGRG